MLPLNRQVGWLHRLLLTLTLIHFFSPPPLHLRGAELARRPFAIPAADAEVTLETFSDQAGAQLVYLIDDVRGVTTQPVQGTFAIRDALERLVAHTALRVELDGKTGAFVIRREPNSRAEAESPLPTNQALPTTMKKSPRSLLAALAGLITLGSPAGAQNAALPKGEEPLVLSPFTVDTSRDTGYAASSTLAGTRFNTALRDVAAPVAVLTPEFLKDIGAHTVLEAASFAVSTERDPSGFDASSNAPGAARIRGLFVRSNSQDFFNTNFPLDDYNLDQISINRGPNSLLFGIGSPGGLVTGVTKRAGFRDQGSAYVEVGSHRRLRSVVDLNRVLVPDRLALRVAVLHRDTDTFREATEWKDRRIYGALTWKIFNTSAYQTTFRANVENGGAERISGNLNTPTDAISTWLAAGRPLLDGLRPATAGALPAGVVNAAGTANLVVVDGSPTAVPILNWQATVRGNNPTPAAGLGPNSPVGLNYNYLGPVRSIDFYGTSHSFFLEQQVGENLFAELGYFKNTFDNTWVRDPSGGTMLTVDANRLLPNGAPNPNAGQIYTEGAIRPQVQERFAEELRLSLSYKLDLTRRSRWLGEHRLGLLASHRRDDFAFDDMQEVNTTPLPGYIIATEFHLLLCELGRHGLDVGLVDGPIGKGTLDAISATALTLTFTWGPPPAPADPITLLLGLPRPQTARDILRDATTLGVGALHFVATERSDPSPPPSPRFLPPRPGASLSTTTRPPRPSPLATYWATLPSCSPSVPSAAGGRPTAPRCAPMASRSCTSAPACCAAKPPSSPRSLWSAPDSACSSWTGARSASHAQHFTPDLAAVHTEQRRRLAPRDDPPLAFRHVGLDPHRTLCARDFRRDDVTDQIHLRPRGCERSSPFRESCVVEALGRPQINRQRRPALRLAFRVDHGEPPPDVTRSIRQTPHRGRLAFGCRRQQHPQPEHRVAQPHAHRRARRHRRARLRARFIDPHFRRRRHRKLRRKINQIPRLVARIGLERIVGKHL